jgi:hypothetical protein
MKPLDEAIRERWAWLHFIGLLIQESGECCEPHSDVCKLVAGWTGLSEFDCRYKLAFMEGIELASGHDDDGKYITVSRLNDSAWLQFRANYFLGAYREYCQKVLKLTI